jgi:F0F1-type ATP synthase membrane subunit a
MNRVDSEQHLEGWIRWKDRTCPIYLYLFYYCSIANYVFVLPALVPDGAAAGYSTSNDVEIKVTVAIAISVFFFGIFASPGLRPGNVRQRHRSPPPAQP